MRLKGQSRGEHSADPALSQHQNRKPAAANGALFFGVEAMLILVPGAGDRVDWSPMIRDQLTIATVALAISFVSMAEVMLTLMYD